MNYLKSFMLILVVLLSDVGFSQTILKRQKNYVVVDIDEMFGLQVNDRVNVYRNFDSGAVQNIGTLKVVLFKKGKCIAQIVSENTTFPIEIGDFISLEDNFSSKQEKKSALGNSSSKKNNTFSYVSFGLGIAASGLGYYFHEQANQNYNDYKAATTSQDAKDLFDQTIAIDKKAKIGLGVGGGLIAMGLISYLLNHKKSQPGPDHAFSLNPVLKKNYWGLGVNLNFNHPSRR